MAAVPSSLSLSTTMTLAGPHSWPRMAWRVSRSTSDRFLVTTTAATRGRVASGHWDPPPAVEHQVPATADGAGLATSIGRSDQLRHAHRREAAYVVGLRSAY